MAQRLEHLPAMQETWVLSLGRENPLEKEMATGSSTIAWRIPWMEEPGGLQSTGSQRVEHDWTTSVSLRNQLFLRFIKRTIKRHRSSEEKGIRNGYRWIQMGIVLHIGILTLPKILNLSSSKLLVWKQKTGNVNMSHTQCPTANVKHNLN